VTALNVNGDLSDFGLFGLDADTDDCRCGKPMPYGAEMCDDCAAAATACPTCFGAGGWQQYDGLTIECPRGCWTEAAA
jgi:hypothetical protein